MKKRVLIGILFAIIIVQVGFLFASNLYLSSGITPKSANASESTLYNLTVSNTNTADVNFTQINITLPSGFSFVSSTNGTDSNSSFSVSGSKLVWNNKTATGIIQNGSNRHFWFNATNANKVGKFNFTISVLDTAGKTNSTTDEVALVDEIPPVINFAGPTPANNSISVHNYLPVNVTATDNVGIQWVSISLSGPNYLNVSKKTSSPFFINFTNLTNGKYNLSATANDTSGNIIGTSIRYITINYSSSSTSACVENWACAGNSSWGDCNNQTKLQFCSNLTDLSKCGTTNNKPANVNRTCTPKCSPNWDCGDGIYKPVNCTAGETQTLTCTDTSSCNNPPDVRTRPCNISSGSSGEGQTGKSPVSGLFLGIIAFIILSVVIVVVVLMKLKNKPLSTGDFGYRNNKFGNNPPSSPPPGYPPQYPPGPPPGYPPSYGGPPRY